MKAKHAGGRPTLYRRELCSQIEEAMATGLTAEAAAAKVGISARSLFYWQQQHPEFLQAIQEGRQRSLLFWEERGIAIANGEPGNTQMVMLGLRNRSRAASGWNNDTLKLEHSGPEGGPLEVKAAQTIDCAALSQEQRDQFREILLAAKALGCPCRKSDPTICMMEAAQNRPCGDSTQPLNRTNKRHILAQG